MAIIKKFRIKSFKKSVPLISFNKVSISFGKRQILDDVSFKVNPGEILGLLGPKGAGKSTIFNILTGLIKPDYGKILFESNDATNYPIYLRTRKFKIGLIPQYGGYFNDLTLNENLNAIAEILIDNKNEKIYKVNELIAKFELDNVREVKAKFLSCGQRRKLVICMALLGDPKIMHDGGMEHRVLLACSSLGCADGSTTHTTPTCDGTGNLSVYLCDILKNLVEQSVYKVKRGF